MDAPSPVLDLATALATPPGGEAGLADLAGERRASREEARRLLESEPVLLAHASLTARRLSAPPPPRSKRLLDVLELYAFVRPARFCAPSPTGLALAMGLAEPRGAAAQAGTLRRVASLLLDDLAATPTESLPETLAVAETLGRAGWAWAPNVIGALRPVGRRRLSGSGGLDVWNRLAEWEDRPSPGAPGTKPVAPAAARERLASILASAGLDEARPEQASFAAETTHIFQPREHDGQPMTMLAEAGTGVGKTLGYLAPATLWAEANGPGVWISTFTRALQRQIERESARLPADNGQRALRAVVRKGRENYLCLLNFQEAVNAAQLGAGDVIGLALAARWARRTRDGDMTGGDFPPWLPSLFAISPQAQASPGNLVDRRGECIHAGCPHYRVCFVEKAIRSSRGADLVIANHALVMTHAAFDAVGSRRPDAESVSLKRIVFDEGHHLFDAADSAFSAVFSGVESAEMRRWIRGPEGRGRRGRGLEARLNEVIGDRAEARAAISEAVRAAALLPGEGWSGRIAPIAGAEARPSGPIEAFLAEVMVELKARAEPSDIAMECPARPALPAVRDAARSAGAALVALEAPLAALIKCLENILDEDADSLGANERARIEGALRGLLRRGAMMLPAWRAMLVNIEAGAEDHPDFVDWFEATFLFGRVVDAAFRRHWIDPTEPLAATVIAPAHGVLVTSATMTDAAFDDPFSLARTRTGVSRMANAPKTLRLASPFDYGANALALVVGDVRRDEPRQVAAAMRELFLAAGGGGLGLFTAVRRLRAVYDWLAEPLAASGLALYAQHVDPLETGALVDIFRAEEDSCLLGTDAVRDGVDVPGRSLRLLVFDRVPWPRPDILHRARRERFGGRIYDDAVARGRIAQAFGRLVRRADDRGVFVMLDAAAPSRLFLGLPQGVVVERVSLVEAIEATAAHLRVPAGDEDAYDKAPPRLAGA